MVQETYKVIEPILDEEDKVGFRSTFDIDTRVVKKITKDLKEEEEENLAQEC